MNVLRMFGLLRIGGFLAPSVSIITIAPQNEAKYQNETVELACEFDSNTYELYWSECLNGKDDCSNLFRDGEALAGANPPPHYSMVNRTGSTGKRFDLVITGVQTTDDGKFRCGVTSIAQWAYAEVIVIVTTPASTITDTTTTTADTTTSTVTVSRDDGCTCEPITEEAPCSSDPTGTDCLSSGGVAGVAVGFMTLLASNVVLCILYCPQDGRRKDEPKTSATVHGAPVYQKRHCKTR